MKHSKTNLSFVLRCLSAAASIALFPSFARAAGVLTPVGSPNQPVQLESHRLEVVVNNGFVRSVVEQVFYNPNSTDLEAIYRAPVPKSGALSELTIWAGERVLQGEVVAKEEADQIYREEKSQGNDVAKADRDGYRDFEFSVSPVPAGGRVRMRYVYYEPLSIESGVGRYLYRLEDGGTDDESTAFWTRGDVVEAQFEIQVTLKSSWPVSRIRTPMFNGSTETLEDGSTRYRYSSQGGRLNKDFVFYYLLEENLPGRLEMMTYRENKDKPGTFMMLLTPGEDLAPLTAGSDYVFVLDTSGSMQGKLHTLVSGVGKALGELKPEDRFRIIEFSTNARDVTQGWKSATPQNAKQALDRLDTLAATGSTNLYEGLKLSLSRLDADRVVSVILVTDGVANEGVIDPVRFYETLQGHDVRFFGFLLGNGANWPLMELMGEASGGRYRAVSNSDDIIGEILQAKNQIAYESLRDVKLTIDGVKTFDVSNMRIGKIHRGEQLVLFGRYEEGDIGKVRLTARLRGQEMVYETEVVFPRVDTSHPELERMWALDQVNKIHVASLAGLLNDRESKTAIRDIGVAYQIVTDETSMIALDDASFARRGMNRRNLDRVQRETVAIQVSPNQNGAQRVDTSKPMFKKPAPSLGGGGGGALEPWMVCGVVAGVFVWWSFHRPRANVARISSVILAVIALGAVIGRAEERVLATWRPLNESGPSGSIDQSIANFWGVSEERARVTARPISPSVPVSLPNVGHQSADTHTLEQDRRRNETRGHFGFNLFNSIPIFDFIWGEGKDSESDHFKGTVRR